MYPIHRLMAETLALLKPPPQLPASQWIERHIVLPEASSARPGRFRLWPYQREIVDCMGDDEHEFVTVLKSSRVGYTKCLVGSIGEKAANRPRATILLVPTDDDARGYAVEEIEPTFEETPALRGLLRTGRVDGRNTLTVKQIAGGGSLKILAARAPRNLRRHDAKDIYVDEEDAMEVTREGDPVALIIKRGMAHADRKVVRGSTPTDEATSSITRAYWRSDQRVYEVPCPFCGVFFEILWEYIVWPKGAPEEATCRCPHCEKLIAESHKTAMVAAGQWRATRPDVKGHAGFRLNALISLLPKARWGLLAKEYVEARKAGPAELQVFVNTVLGRPWKQTLDNVDEASLRERVEDLGLIETEKGKSRFPADVFLLVAGVDTQDDRFEAVIWGFNEDEAILLSHQVVWGDPADATTQAELDALLRTTWLHPAGWSIGIEAAAIDSQGHKTQAVYDFCKPRLARRVYPVISRPGARRLWEPAKKRKDGVRLFVVGHDQVNTLLLQRIAIPPIDEDGRPSPQRLRFSADLPEDTFAQLTGVRRFVRYTRGNKTVIEFRPVREGAPLEAWDASCYAFALRSALRVNFAERRARRGASKPPAPLLGDLSKLLNR